MKKIAIASDHAAFEYKTKLIARLNEAGYEAKDFGCEGLSSCDYPDYGIPACQSVAAGESDFAILCCNNGIGMSILANKVDGVVAALVYSEETAKMTRQHHGSNVLCLGAQQFPEVDLDLMVDTWLATEFEAGRHARRIGKVTDLEK